jgi:hypothetical protein
MIQDVNFNQILSILNDFQNQHPNIYIGGSTSLILQEVIPFRIPQDIDIITPTRIHIYDIFNVDKNKTRFRRTKTYKYNDLKFDLFINPSCDYIEYNYKNYHLKLSPVDEIYKWKINPPYSIDTSTQEKHIFDIKYYEIFKRTNN